MDAASLSKLNCDLKTATEELSLALQKPFARKKRIAAQERFLSQIGAAVGALTEAEKVSSRNLEGIMRLCGDAPIQEIPGVENLSQVIYNLLCPDHYDLLERIRKLEHKVSILETENSALKDHITLSQKNP